MKNRALFCTLLLLSLTLCLSSGTYSSPQGGYITLYAEPGFKGTEMHYGVHSLSLENFNDLTSSIRVPDGWVVIVYEHAADGGGYGRWVDFLEDQPDLTKYNLDNQISYLQVFRRVAPDGKYWVRNGYVEGRFMEGYWFRSRKGPPHNPTAVVAPPKAAPPPTICTISGRVIGDKREYGTRITLHGPGGTPTQFSVRVINGQYTIPNVPAGNYEVRGTGTYPSEMTTRGPIGLKIVSQGDQAVTCGHGQPVSKDFKIVSSEG